MTLFVKRLDARDWFGAVWPWLIWQRLCGRIGPTTCYIYEGSPAALKLAAWSGRLIRVRVERLVFSLTEVRDEQGRWMRLVVAAEDVPRLQAELWRQPSVQAAAHQASGRWPAYLSRALTPSGFFLPDALWCVALAVRLAAWHRDRQERQDEQGVIFLESRPWFHVVAQYAASHGLTARRLPRAASLAWKQCAPILALRRWRFQRRLTRAGAFAGMAAPAPVVRIGVDFQGYAAVDNSRRYSDLFFFRPAGCGPGDVVLLVKGAGVPDGARAQMERAGIKVAQLDPYCATIQPDAERQAAAGKETAWLRARRTEYAALRDYWAGVFARYGIRLFVTWFKYDRLSFPIAEALAARGGISAMYQRAYESFASPHLACAPDVMFGFSASGAAIEARSGSSIPYYITTGYLGDARTELWRPEAQALRAALEQRGARRIIAFADENTAPTPSPWHPNHDLMRRYYAFLCERVLEEPWLGLVIKPKVPSTIRQRLGPIAELLRTAEATGRCVVLEGGAHQSDQPPVAAALAADVMIHGYLFAATAGIESALAGVPTLLIDHEGWPDSSLYRLGVGRVVFYDVESAWEMCREQWSRAGGVPGFGDWTSMLDELDPFRDGRAAERMGTYVRWLVDGLRAGRSRDTVLVEAADRYAQRWGREHVTSVNAATAQPEEIMAGRR